MGVPGNEGCRCAGGKGARFTFSGGMVDPTTAGQMPEIRRLQLLILLKRTAVDTENKVPWCAQTDAELLHRERNPARSKQLQPSTR